MAANRRMKAPLSSLQSLRPFYTGGTVSVTPDEEGLICVCGEELKVVNSKSGDVTQTLPGDSEPLTAMCVHPSGSVVITSSRSLMSKLWSLQTGRCVKTWKAHTAPVADVTFDASGGYFATASACREVKVWDTDSGLCTHCLLGHTGMVMRVLFHPSQPLLATSGDDGVVNLWDLKSKNVVYKLTGHVSAVSAIAWASDGAHLVSGGRDKVAILWDTRTGTKVRSIAVLEAVETLVVLPHTVSQRIYAPDSNCAPSIMFATGGEAGVVKFWSAQTGRCVVNGHVAAHGSAADAIVNLAVLSQSQELMCATADCTMAFMSVRGRCLTVERTFLGNLGEVTSAVFLESSASPMQDEASGCVQESLQGPAPPGCVAVATNSKNVFLLSSKSFACLGMFEGHRDIVLCIAAHCFQRRTDPVWLIASGSKDNTVRLWHVSTGRCLAIGDAHLGSVTTVSFFSQQSPSLLSGGADKLIQMWDLSCLWEILQGSTIPAEPVKLAVSAAVAAHEKEVNCVAVSPSNAYAASGGADRNARVWKLPALSAAVVLSGHRRGVWDIQFAPVDQAVLTASADATLRIWSVKDGLCIRTFLGHGASILHARFSAEGLRIVSGGTDGLLKGWNAQTGQCLFTEEAHDGKIWALDVGGAHQSFVVSGADDGSLVVWGDETKADADAQRQKIEHDVQELQVLENAVIAKQYVHAAKLAIQLQKPSKLLQILQDALANTSGSSAPDFKLIIRDLNHDHLRRLLVYLRDWNTSPKHFNCAHALLHAVLSTRHPQELIGRLHGLQDIFEGLLLYSSRHYDRMDRLLQSTFLLDYMQFQLQGYGGTGIS